MIGKEILNYRITGILGKGGMGTVYLGVNKFIQEQKVAIKVINADMLNDFTRKRLEEEAHRLAALNHANIVRLINFHIDEYGSVYLIMEYVDGYSIEKYLREINGLVVEDRICPIFEPILDGMGYAHKQGIVHCDIKPANIVMTTEGTSKILDFGIAQIVNGQDLDGKTKMIMGTPSYMSPEQVRGEELDARSDIYSLGVLLHQMLTGNAPYDTTTLTEQEINQKVVEEPLPRMATYYKYVSEKVQNVVDKATAKNPDERYQTCEEFKKALHKAVVPGKMPIWAKYAAAATIAIIAGIGGYIWDYNRIKVSYYKDYAECWGVPVGIGELSTNEHKHMNRSYKFVECQRKLLRVSHVNSLDNIIEDGESERNERPLDQEFSYTEKGKVSTVKVKDRSGKVLYVKSYNDKLNVMAFQYDDEHNTERIISNSTVGYGRLLEDNNKEHGKISRWWIEYDEHGFAKSERFHSLDNSPIGDANGIYGREYVRDSKGRPVEIHYIGIDGKPQSTKWGLGIKKFEYDKEDNWTKATYLTPDCKTAYDDMDGIAIFSMTYDKYGNVEYAYHLNGDGTPMLPKKNYISGIHYTYDDLGFITATEYLDIEHKPMFVKDAGYAIIKYEYDEYGYENKKTYCDPSGNITDNKDGYAISEMLNDENGNSVELWCKNKQGEFCETTDGWSGAKAAYDSVGNLTKLIYYDAAKRPVLDKDGTAGTTYSYNDKHLVTEIINLGKDLKPAANKNMVVRTHYEYDKRGNVTKCSFYEADGKTLRLSGEGISGWYNDYDENGNQMERRFFDTNEKAVISPVLYYAKVKYTYDANGHQSSTRYYDTSDKLVLVNGIAGTDYVNDKRGNTMEDKPVGTDEKLASGKLITKFKYDQYDNLTEQSLYNESGPTLNSLNVHRYKFVYNSRNQCVEERHYDINGKLTLINDNESHSAIIRNEYNNKGEHVKRSYFGTDERPCLCLEKWSSATYEFDTYGNVIKQCFFGIDGQPTDPQIMVPVGIARYDKWGNMIYIAAQDSKGNFINKANNNWSISRMQYDDRNNKIEQSYFDTKDNPTRCEEGYHKEKHIYDTQSRCIETAYFGINDEAILCYGVHKEKYEYENQTDNIKLITFYDSNDKPTNCDAGWQKLMRTFDSQGIAQTMKYYDAHGTLVKNLMWDGTKWGVVHSWQDDARSLAGGLPMTSGSLTIYALKVTGSNSCELKIRIPHTRSELDDSTFGQLTENVKKITREVEKKLGHKPYVTSILYDKNGIALYSVKV